ncbi:MAG: hypothetical protein CVV52_15480, partial [Spirochaetae bacterium HGW-Spirochaetae-8]
FFRVKNKNSFAINGDFPFGGSGSVCVRKEVIVNKTFDNKEKLFEDWLFFIDLFIHSESVFYYNISTIKINYDDNSLSRTRTIEDVNRIPKIYYFLKDNNNFTLSNVFFWTWLNFFVSCDQSVKTNFKILAIHRNELLKNLKIRKRSIKLMFIVVAKLGKNILFRSIYFFSKKISSFTQKL